MMQSENVGCEFNKILISIQRCKPFRSGGEGDRIRRAAFNRSLESIKHTDLQ